MGYPIGCCITMEIREIIEALQFDFMHHAMAAGLLASVICGIMGTLVVVNRIVFLFGGRAFYYGLAPNEHHAPHPHFYCKSCGRMDCLSPGSLLVEADPLWKTFPGQIDKVEVRVDGICKNCLRIQSH